MKDQKNVYTIVVILSLLFFTACVTAQPPTTPPIPGIDTPALTTQTMVPASTEPEPTAPPTTAPTVMVESRPALTLREAIEQKLVTFTATGSGLEYLDLVLDSQSDQDLTIEIQPGTIFKPGSGAVQAMVVRRGYTIDLDSGQRGEAEISVACANMHKDMPGSSDSFEIDFDSAPAELRSLLSLPEFRAEEFRVQQFAIWTITDNPGRSDYVGIGYSGTGSGPDTQELEKIFQLFQKAGIQTAKYNALKQFSTP